MTQTDPTPPPKNDAITTYGPLVLSALVIIFIAMAFFLRYIDWQAAIDVMGIILGANGLYIATRWQAAPGLIVQIQEIIAQLTEHIQSLHGQQSPQNQTRVTSAYVPPVAGVPPRASRLPNDPSVS